MHTSTTADNNPILQQYTIQTLKTFAHFQASHVRNFVLKVKYSCHLFVQSSKKQALHLKKQDMVVHNVFNVFPS